MAQLDEGIVAWLKQFLGGEGAAAGTVHRADHESSTLALVAAVNIPPPVVAATQTVQRGKGMAGLAWAREQPVSTCNLQDDESGDVRPGAKAVAAQAAVALPVTRDEQIVGVVGLAWMGERELSEAELTRLRDAASDVPL